jgi:hypothetical protein
MLLTYTLTVRLLARQRQSLGGCGSKVTTGGWSGWMGAAAPLGKFLSNLYYYVFVFVLFSNNFLIYLLTHFENVSLLSLWLSQLSF